MYHVSFIFTFNNDPKKLFGKIIFSYLDHPDKNLDAQIKAEIFEATSKTIDTLGIISVFNHNNISENEKHAFDLYIHCLKDYYRISSLKQ